MAEKLPNQDALDLAVRRRQEARDAHDDFVELSEKRYKTYRGVLERASDAAQWTSKAHPPYIQHIVETTLASQVVDQLRFKISPNATIHTMEDEFAAKRAEEGAHAHQALFDWQMKADHFTDIQRPFVLQNHITGLTVNKTFWTRRAERRRVMSPTQVQLPGPDGEPIIGPDGQPVMITEMQEQTKWVTAYDGPTTEVRDVRDFMYAPNAVSLAKAPWVIDRVWKLPEEIWMGFEGESPIFGPSRGGWSEKQCREVLAVTPDSSRDELPGREKELFNIDRVKGLVEVWEVWDNVKKTVTTVANGSVLLSHREEFPFFHNEYPFVVCTTQPDLFRIPGISQVEKIEHLQTLLWDVTNQSLDNLRLVNNAIFWFRPDVEDIDQYEFYPGARWLVEDPSQVNQWSPNPLPAEVSLNRESLIKGDMQNMSGSFPFSSGTDSGNVDQKTATGASLVSNLAQRSIDMANQQLNTAWRDTARQRMLLNQQFIRVPTVAPFTALDDEKALKVILPEMLSGDYDLAFEPQPDAMMKQEGQAAANALMTLALQAFPVFQAAGQNGAATPLNLDAFMEDALKAYGKEDMDKYFSKTNAQALPQAPPGGGGGAPPPPGAEAPPMGITGQGSIDPSVSPSAMMSQSPVTAMQRVQALDNS